VNHSNEVDISAELKSLADGLSQRTAVVELLLA
jgi:hypothetical protein